MLLFVLWFYIIIYSVFINSKISGIIIKKNITGVSGLGVSGLGVSGLGVSLGYLVFNTRPLTLCPTDCSRHAESSRSNTRTRTDWPRTPIPPKDGRRPLS
jgi:hypothetical protein